MRPRDVARVIAPSDAGVPSAGAPYGPLPNTARAATSRASRAANPPQNHGRGHPMPREFHLFGLGNALVDIFLEVSDAELASLGFEKGSMRLVERDEQRQLLERFRGHEPRLVSGGSVGPEQAPILLATAVAIIATIAQIGYLLARGRKVDGMLWVSLAIIVVFGGATIYFHNEAFIKWKPTVLYWVFAVVLLGAQLLMNKNLIRMMMKGQVELPDPIWTRLNLAWAAFFAAMGVINLYIAFNFATSTWVNFKLFGFMGLMIAFVVAQTMFLSKYIKDPG